ncbi:hypothetical protein [uncultured Pseudokineococcus sp.]|uniref:hypothetical protein n=1 Tax=uncultured Pseudokineococcus sp. TaxID=1642928 RepID=UPI002602C921|nr:hypothetical protein [uncultured Pseudokineococcus sp.]
MVSRGAALGLIALTAEEGGGASTGGGLLLVLGALLVVAGAAVGMAAPVAGALDRRP